MESKITLSKAEYDLIRNAEWFLTKQRIIDKVYLLLAEILEQAREILPGIKTLEPYLEQSPKIYKGENYKGLPWVTLDYPRNFSSEKILAIRTMFWWANYFIVTLHVKGVHKQNLKASKNFNLETLQHLGFYISVNSLEWEHHLGKDNYVKATDISNDEFVALVYQKEFLKIAKIHPLTEWDNAVMQIPNIYKEMMSFYES